MFNCKTPFTTDMQKELNHTRYVWGVVLTAIGLVGVSAFLVVAFCFPYLDYLFTALIFSFLPLIFGGMIVWSCIRQVKIVSRMNIINTYDFAPDFVVITTIRNGETIGLMKVYYTELKKVKETENYLFLYQNPTSAFPVKKSEFNVADLIILRGIFRIYKLMKLPPKAEQETKHTSV